MTSSQYENMIGQMEHLWSLTNEKMDDERFKQDMARKKVNYYNKD